MKFIYTRRAHLSSLAATLGLAVAGKTMAAAPVFDGTWTGLLELGNTRLTLRMIIAGDTVNLIDVDHGGSVIAANDVAITADRIRLAVKAISASFEGRLTADGFIDGVFTQGRAFHMCLGRGEDIVPSSVWRRLTPALLNDRRITANTPAIGAAWARGQKSDLIVRGVRSSNTEIAVQPEDQWHWGSITKSMTSTLCARLVEAGVIGWDTTIASVLDTPDFSVPQAYRDATLLHLLSHRAGLESNVTGTGYSAELKDARAERLKYAREALAQAPVAAVGKKKWPTATTAMSSPAPCWKS